MRRIDDTGMGSWASPKGSFAAPKGSLAPRARGKFKYANGVSILVN